MCGLVHACGCAELGSIEKRIQTELEPAGPRASSIHVDTMSVVGRSGKEPGGSRSVEATPNKHKAHGKTEHPIKFEWPLARYK